MNFFKIAIQDFRVGAVLPSSSAVAERISQLCLHSEHLLEYGPGDGAITKALLLNLKRLKKITAIELNKNFVQELKKISNPRLSVIAGDVTKIISGGTLLKNYYDTVVSGIPFSFLKPKDREKTILETHALLKENGKCIFYQTTPALVPTLKKYFAGVTWEIIWRNFPPYFIIIAVK